MRVNEGLERARRNIAYPSVSRRPQSIGPSTGMRSLAGSRGVGGHSPARAQDAGLHGVLVCPWWAKAAGAGP